MRLQPAPRTVVARHLVQLREERRWRHADAVNRNGVTLQQPMAPFTNIAATLVHMQCNAMHMQLTVRECRMCHASTGKRTRSNSIST